MPLHPLPALRDLAILAAALCALACTAAHARLIERIIKVPVKVTNAYGKVIEQEVVVSTYHDRVIRVRFQLIPGSPIRSGMTLGCRA